MDGVSRRFVFSAPRFTNRLLWEVLPDGAWQGKPAFVVGGGPSLSEFDWKLLRGKRVIGVNRVYERIDPTIIFSMDTRFLQWIIRGKYGPEAREKFMLSKAYKVWLCTYNCSLPDYCFILKVFKNYQMGFKSFPRSMREGLGHGNNSGFGALNLAVCLQANPIYLIGFDMKHRMQRTHWHDGHPHPQTADKVQGFIKYFQLAAKSSREYGIQVINLNPDSALPFFPKQKLSEVLH